MAVRLHIFLVLIFLLIFNITCLGIQSSSKQDHVINSLNVPENFSIEYYARNVPNARSLTLSKNGIVYVGTRRGSKVYALVDRDNDNYAEEMITIDEDLNYPNGVAYYKGDLYVAEINRILRYPNIDDNLYNPPQPEIITDVYPTDVHHGWKYIAFGPDGHLYIPVGAPCNICEPESEIYASITRFNLKTKKMDIIAKGVRNTVGFAWHPTSKKLWFTDNGRDWMGDDLPPCELNILQYEGEHFGYPYIHGKDIKDPEYGKQGDKLNISFSPPALELDAHVAPLGMVFYNGTQFPKDYYQQIFVAEHGSWNRSKKSGYRVMLVKLENEKVVSSQPFITGWLQADESVLGRPVDLIELTDGSLLISDDFHNAIYRLSYKSNP